ncbi:MAG: hypothetical protein J2P37_13650 [Ktedonobacteraceae bacterium]|nr:hypothetical protein [Ktedonobacteraceae bacterium]
MASAESQKPTCPVCSQADQVKTMRAAYESGVDQCAPPDMPTKKVLMMPFIITSAVVVGICIFFVVVLIGSLESNLPELWQYILTITTLVCIVAALVVSYIAFQRVVKGDADATERFPAWDRAMNTWRNLYYCARDNAVFDPKTKQTLSERQLAVLRSMDEESIEVKAAAVARQQ